LCKWKNIFYNQMFYGLQEINGGKWAIQIHKEENIINNIMIQWCVLVSVVVGNRFLTASAIITYQPPNTYLLTYGAEPFLKSCQFCSSSRISNTK
jgi:hypothetical protein